MSTILEIKSNFPKLTQKQTAQQLEYPDFPIKRHRDQINMPSPDNRKKTQRKKMSSEEGSMIKKGGNCESEDGIVSGKKLIDRAFRKKCMIEFIKTNESNPKTQTYIE